MNTQTILWTACPHGLKGGRLGLSVFVSFRLEVSSGPPAPTLALFPEVLSWPASEVAFDVVFESPGGATVTVRKEAVRLASPARDRALWRALFDASTPVRPYAFEDLSRRALRTYSISGTHRLLKSGYQAVAAGSPRAHPPTSAVLAGNALRPFAIAPGEVPVLQRAVRLRRPTVSLTSGKQPTLHMPAAGELSHLLSAVDPRKVPIAAVQLFHRPSRSGADQAGASGVPIVQGPDFHDAVAALGQYPAILRRLGLVFDLDLAVPAGLAAQGTVRVVPRWTPARAATQGSIQPTTRDVAPRTTYQLTRESFTAAARPTPPIAPGGPDASPDLAGGWLALGAVDKFELFELDLDSAVLKASDFATSLLRLQHDAALSPPDVGQPPRSSGEVTPPPPTKINAPVPALRNAGITLARADRGAMVALQLAVAAGHDKTLQGSDPADLTGGVTLHAEDITRGYRVDVFQESRRAWFSLCKRVGHYTAPGSPAPLDATVADEGWASFALTQLPSDPADAAGDGPELGVHEALFRWSGWSLAAPRPGNIVADDGSLRASQDTSVPAGPLKLQVTFTPQTGSLPRLRFGDTYKLRARAVDLAGNSAAFMPDETGTPAGAESAPLTYSRFEPIPSPVLVERTTPGLGESSARLVIRSAYDPATGAFLPPAVTQRHVVPPAAAQSLAETHGAFDTHGTLDRGSYAIIAGHEGTLPNVEPATTVALPYLPDPLAGGAAFGGLPGVARDTPLHVPFGGPWPNAQSFLLTLSAGNAGTPPSLGQNSLQVFLDRGEQALVQLSSYPAAGGVDVMGLWKWIQEHGSATAGLRALAESGALWMLTPFHEITLVHAVQVPTLAPVFKHLTATRERGQTFAVLRDTVSIDGKSTAMFELLAEWDEPLDDINLPGPTTRHGTARPIALTIEPLDTHVHLTRDWVDVVTEEPGDPSPPGPRPTSSSHPAKPRKVYHEYADKHIFGDTKYRLVTYRGSAVTRFAEYFPPDTATLTRESAPVAIKVLNAARPAAPLVKYVVPTFGWATRTQGNATIRTRSGGLRVYLDRPWYSSGDGERLGVLYAPLPAADFLSSRDIFEPLRPFVTQWGTDPVSTAATDESGSLQPSYPDTSSVYAVQSAVNFTYVVHREVMEGLSLDEMAAYETGHSTLQSRWRVGVAPHEVSYDPDRRLWFADLAIDAGPTGNAFVRLALARFQPNSLDDCHLSRVVLADFAQLTPERAASLVYDAVHNMITVTVSGHARSTFGYTTSDGLRIVGPHIEAALETRLNGGADAPWTPVLVVDETDNGYDPGTEGPPHAGGTPPPPPRHPKPVPHYVPYTVTLAAVASGDPLPATGLFNLPQRRGSVPYRLVIREYEVLPADSPSGLRLVYADAIELR